MREIKFRAWVKYDDKNGEMLPNVQNHINGSWAFGHLLKDPDTYVMQFTGLTDKNGVEIYEGDIVDNGNDGFCEVVFSKRAAKFCVRVLRDHTYGGKEKRTHSLLNCGNVVGNIHQNPELLPPGASK